MKPLKIILILLAISLSIFVFVKPSSPKNESKPQEFNSQKVTTIIYTDDQNKLLYSSDYQSSQSALMHLEIATTNNNLQLQTKTYPFGTIVESIGSSSNSNQKAWIYYINNQSATIGADKYILNPSDVIEWKFVKPE